MSDIPFPGDSYVTPEGKKGFFPGLFPSLFFWLYAFKIVRHDGALAKSGKYGGAEWAEGSRRTVDSLERCGVRLDISGMRNIDRVDGSCVFIANHMSTLETFVLPSLVQPRKPVTFVVKASLLGYPWFGPVLAARDPIVVNRKNPREDLAVMLGGGAERLEKGSSIIVFPQGNRNRTFAPEMFNSIGVKLAKRADRPVIPIALRTDAWKVGRFIKDFGGIDPALPVRIAFGEPMFVSGNGKAEHAAVCDFIQGKLVEWS